MNDYKARYDAVLAMLKEAPPWQAIGDERYRRWYLRAMELVDKAK